jgi:hypothetical protein
MCPRPIGARRARAPDISSAWAPLPAARAAPTLCYGPPVAIINRRNAVLGWSVWQIGKRVGKKKARGAVPNVESGRPNKSAIALATLAGAAGALTFWRKKKTATE